MKKSLGKRCFSRDFIVLTACKLIAEGVPYRIYRLDIKSFFESIDHDFLKNSVRRLSVNPLTTKNLFYLLDIYAGMGGTGVPRGLGISSTLAEIALSDFDHCVSNLNNVYYYIRYVDDILLISNRTERKVDFFNKLESLLPIGLLFNRSSSKLSIQEAINAPEWSLNNDKLICKFSYLGYEIKVHDAQKIRSLKNPIRKVTLDIADSKVKKIKTRIVRSFIAYLKDKKFQDLRDRLRLLTNNYSIYDIDSGRKKFVGIYYSYPFISQDSVSIVALDKFINNAILSRTGRVFSRTSKLLTSNQKSDLLQFKFSIGHSKKKFVHFSPAKIQKLQECWDK